MRGAKLLIFLSLISFPAFANDLAAEDISKRLTVDDEALDLLEIEAAELACGDEARSGRGRFTYATCIEEVKKLAGVCNKELSDKLSDAAPRLSFDGYRGQYRGCLLSKLAKPAEDTK